MNQKLKIIGLLAAGVVAVPSTAIAATQLNSAPTQVVLAAASTSSISPARADAIAINAVGGGSVRSTSGDTYQGAPVYDIHVLHGASVYDVKVSRSNGAVMQEKLSSEQPSNPGQSFDN